MSQKLETYVSVQEGESLSKMTEKKFEKSVADARATNTAAKEGDALVDVPEATFKQTFVTYEAASLEEAQSYIPDENVLLTFFNRGWSLHQQKLISDLITDNDFTPVEGNYDLIEAASRLPERTRTKKAMSTDDMISHLKSLPKEQRDAIIAEFMAALTEA